jgi:non-specific serine/threonine protein kinase
MSQPNGSHPGSSQPDRDEALQATRIPRIEWSDALLGEKEQTLLARLSVFMGGARLKGVETVCSGGGMEARGRIEVQEMPDLLSALVDRGLVRYEEASDEGRYQMLETVREVAREKLEEGGEAEAVAERHRDYLLTLAEEADQGLQGPEQGRWLSRLEAEHANLRAALAWSMHNRQEVGAAAALRLCGALHHFWWVRGYLDEGRRWCAAALELADAAGRSAERARVLNNTGVLARMQGDYAAARAYHEQALAIRREIGDQPGIAASLNGLGNMVCGQGDYAAARLYYEQSLNIKREIGNRKAVAGSLNNLGYVAYLQGDTPSARLYYEQSLTLWRALGNPQDIVLSLEGFAEVAVAEREWERGARLWGMADLLREQIGAPLPDHDREARDRDVAAMRQALGEEAFATAYVMGRALTLEQAIADALNLPPSPYAAEQFTR